MKFNPKASLVSNIKMALVSNKLTCTVPYTSINLEIVKKLLHEGYLHAISVNNGYTNDQSLKTTISLKFKRHHNNIVMRSIKLMSRPGKKEYWSYKHLKNYILARSNTKVLLSTDKGVISSDQALNERIGGEVLFEYY